MNQDRVITAFETLLNKLTTVVNQTNAQVPQALGDGNHDEAARLVESSQYVNQFKGKINHLRSEWLARLAPPHLNPGFTHTDTKTKKQSLETIARGLSIPLEVSIIEDSSRASDEMPLS